MEPPKEIASISSALREQCFALNYRGMEPKVGIGPTSHPYQGYILPLKYMGKKTYLEPKEGFEPPCSYESWLQNRCNRPLCDLGIKIFCKDGGRFLHHHRKVLSIENVKDRKTKKIWWTLWELHPSKKPCKGFPPFRLLEPILSKNIQVDFYVIDYQSIVFLFCWNQPSKLWSERQGLNLRNLAPKASAWPLGYSPL